MGRQKVEADIVVVGAGLAGLSAARSLRASGSDVAVVEARDRVGGRVLNHQLPGGEVVEIGGEWIGPQQLRVNKLVAELGLETFPTYDTGENLLDLNGKVKHYTGDIPPLPKAALVDLGQSQLRFDRLAKRVPLEAPWAADQAERWDEETFATWMRRNTRTASARFFWEVFSEAVFAAEPQDMSLLHALAYTHSGGGVNSLMGVRNAAQQDRIVGGSQLIAQLLAEPLGEDLHLSAPVRKIKQRADGVTVEADGVTVRARRAIVSIPPVLAGRIAYEPALPPQRDLLTQKMPAGSVIKINVVYDEPFWRAEGLSGQAAGDHAPIRFTFDNSPPSGTPGVLVCFLEGAQARRFGRIDAGARRRAVLASLTAYFGKRASKPIDFIEQDWSAEEWTRGCYGAHLAPGVWTQFGPSLREPIGRIHWAGTETAAAWSGYMDGALSSGERAAAEVLAATYGILMPILDASHDFAHPVEGDTAWSESYYFNAYCPVADAGLFTRIGVRPNEGTMDVGLSVWLPNNELAHVVAVREQKEMVDAGLDVGGVRYERIEPLTTWRLTADVDAKAHDLAVATTNSRDTHIAMDLTFNAFTPAVGYDGQGSKKSGASAATSASVGKGHLEQAGRWTGWIEADGVRHKLVDARGNRDKSWGPRRWGGPKMWRWFSINIDDETHFGGIRIGTEAGDLHRGWVWTEGEHSSIKEWKVTSEIADDGVTHTATHVHATDKRGRVHQLDAEVFRVSPGPAGIRPDSTIVNEGLARWTYEGRTGYGISEYLHQLDGQARPVVPIE